MARRLHRELERYRVPKQLLDTQNPNIRTNLRPIFRDRDELSSGTSLNQVIEEALSESESLIVICSPAAVASDWVNDEIRTFQRLGKHKHIFCFIVAGSPLSGDAQECFPKALINPIDTTGQLLTDPEEPLAADASGGKSEWRHAKMMLIAGLLDVGLDRLLQRDHQRRSRNMIAIASGSVAIAVVMAGLAVFAYLSQAEAERRQADADNLVGYLLGDLREELHSIGRVDLYNDVASKAMEYFKSLEDEDARDEVLAQRAEALRQIGSALLARSDTQGAMKAFDESLTISQRLATENPQRLDWNLALAESHFYVGEVYWRRGELDAASKEFQSQLSIVDALASAQPNNLERLTHSGYAWTNYGRILELSGRFDEGLRAYQTVMDVFQRMLDQEPENPETKLEVGFAHNNLGKLKTSLGLLEEAEAHYRSDLKIKQEISATDPANNTWREYTAGSHFWLGKLLQARGDLNAAREQHEFTREILNSLLLNEPDATQPRQRKAAVLTLLAVNCRINLDTACATESITTALADLDTLTSASPDNVRWLHLQSLSQLELSWQAQLRGDHKTALANAQSAKMITDQLVMQAPTDLEVRKSEVLVMLTLGDFAGQSLEAEKAQVLWQSALQILEEHFSDSSDPQVLELQSRLLIRNNRLAEAQIAEDALAQMNYLSPYPWP